MTSDFRANLALGIASLALAVSVGHVMMRLTWLIALAVVGAVVVAGVVAWWRAR